jgi:hypothetical protein
MTMWKRCAALGALVVAIAGCQATKLLDARFEQLGSPAGNLPGSPTGDSVSVDDSTEPEQEDGLLYWRPPPHSKARFRSAAYSNPDTTKTIYWEGKRTAGNTDFRFEIGAEDASGVAPQVPLIITFRQDTAWGQGYIGPVKHSSAFDPNQQHTVFVSLRVGAGQYAIKITSAGAPPIEWEGYLEPATVDRLKSQSRLVMQAGFKETTALKGYRMDNLLMREKK